MSASEVTTSPAQPGALNRRTRHLELALLASFVVHGVAMISMATLLLPMMPGGTTADATERIGRIAAHPWLFRLGWLPWHACALVDVALAVALIRTPWIPRAPAWLTLAFTLVAIVPDQGGQALWITLGVARAECAVALHHPPEYLPFEGEIFTAVAGWGGLFYTLASLGWTWCFARAGAWSRGLTLLSAVLWPTFFLVSLAALVPPAYAPPGMLVAAGNAVAFVLLQIWFFAVRARVLSRARPDARSDVHG